MRHIHSERFTKSFHIMEIRDVLLESQKRLTLPMTFCPHCDTLQEKKGSKCELCQRPVKEMPTDLDSAEAFLEAQLEDYLLFDYRWLNQETQLQLMVLNGRDV